MYAGAYEAVGTSCGLSRMLVPLRIHSSESVPKYIYFHSINFWDLSE